MMTNSVQDAARLVADIRRYAQIETPSGNADALRRLANVLEADARRLGLNVSREAHATGAHLIWTLPRRGEVEGVVLILTHYDTVWPVGTLASRPLELDGDRLTGPGVYDTKAGIAVLMAAIALIHSAGANHPELRILVIADEEVGSPTATTLVHKEASRASIVLGLEPPHPNGGLKTARRGSTRVRLAIDGKEAHAALDPDAGVNAIEELIDQLVILRAEADTRPILFNVGTVRGGGRTNVVPAAAHADIGIRFSDAENESATLQSFKALRAIRAGATVTTTILSRRPPWAEERATQELMDACSRIANRAGQELSGAPADGAADTNTTGSLGLPTLDGLAPDGGGAHAVDEWVSISSAHERVHLLAALFTELPSEVNMQPLVLAGNHDA